MLVCRYFLLLEKGKRFSMARGYKFNAFSGVYTPSVLTILGVIMYMRLGWVVGQAGLIAALIIIVISHVISFTTGLSISSIATDKKIRAGGIYYILSRSLGLPMGGAIGIALTLGTALGISMYIVGFAENFLSIKVISEYLHLGPDSNSIRLVGTVVLLLLTVLAMISTSLAIKTQYFILAAIALSLVSMFAGFGVHLELRPDSPLLAPASGHLPFEKIFAIFFPAVTGFTAGVAMSGDLRDPRKDIPKGTMAAIATGFVIYIVLALGYGLFVSRDILLTDNNVAMHVAWMPTLVVAGIWGATLSSALGGILGAPRILQALSADEITPQIFGKTYGKKNEPRAALVLIYIIAQAGILIGDLNAIAGIVTMFYLTSYGFINLAYVLEGWANTDFRPSFRVPLSVGIVGFIFAFAVMFRIDMISMIAAFVIIGGIYVYLQQKQLKLEGGDVWRSVWISIIRRGLSALIAMPEDDKNWQPNIILFTGGTKQRPHLMEFARTLVGHYGFLTNFDLKVNPEAEVLFPKYKQNYIEPEEQASGIFFRRMTVKDVYQGIEMIVRTYGFSGLEPNTVILGWPRQTENPQSFVRLLRIINSLDYNVVLIDYDIRYGFGRYEQIDIWWRGAGNNGNFALMLAKLMTLSDKWKNALIRLLIVNDDDSKAFYLYRRASDMLAGMRIEAQVKIINNEVERRSFYDIVREQSKTADIVFIGLPDIPQGSESDFIKRTNKLLFEIGTVALIRASRVFKDLNLGVNISQKAVLAQNKKLNKVPDIVTTRLNKSSQEYLYNVLSEFQEKVLNIFDLTVHNFVFKESDDFMEFLQGLPDLLFDINNLLRTNLMGLDEQRRRLYVLRYQNFLLLKMNRFFQGFKRKYLEELNEMLDNLLFELKGRIPDVMKEIPASINLIFDKDELNDLTGLTAKISKIFMHLVDTRQDKVVINYHTKLLARILSNRLLELIFLDVERIRIETLRFVYNFEKFFSNYINFLEDGKKLLVWEIGKFFDNLDRVVKKNLDNFLLLAGELPARVAQYRNQQLAVMLNDVLQKFEHPRSVYFYHKKELKKNRRDFSQRIDNEVEIFFESFDKYLEELMMENYMWFFKVNFLQCLNELRNFLVHDYLKDINIWFGLLAKTKERMQLVLHKIPEVFVVMDKESFNDSFYRNFSHIDLREVSLRYSLEMIVNVLLNKLMEQTSVLQYIPGDLAKKLTEDLDRVATRIRKLPIINM